ncbi:MAG TPA: hypothetical protein VF017_16305 [Thermoanaerobaculia bacterium]|nr:hypothetical protein [Thermoanaerobaculia bacterium]
MATDNAKVLGEESPGVQAHLSILQAVIQRMAANSSSAKAWCITLASAILVVVADKGQPQYALIALIPTVLFLVLDAYYLALERSFRGSYRCFVEKLHQDRATAADLYEVVPRGHLGREFLRALLSFSIWPFYLTLLALIGAAIRLVLS